MDGYIRPRPNRKVTRFSPSQWLLFCLHNPIVAIRLVSRFSPAFRGLHPPVFSGQTDGSVRLPERTETTSCSPRKRLSLHEKMVSRSNSHTLSPIVSLSLFVPVSLDVAHFSRRRPGKAVPPFHQFLPLPALHWRTN